MGDSGRSLMDKLFGNNSSTAGTDFTGGGQRGDNEGPAQQPQQPHRNIFQKLFGIGKKDDGNNPPPPSSPQ